MGNHSASSPSCSFLAQYKLLGAETAVWRWQNHPLPLEISYCLSGILPSLAEVSSVRAILFRKDTVLIICDRENRYYVTPGGRCEENETVLETLRRELLEETGWTFTGAALLGFAHFHYLTPKPNGLPYPHPHFIHPIYIAEADQFMPQATRFDDYVVESFFHPIGAIGDIALEPNQAVLLEAAVYQRNRKSAGREDVKE